MDVRLLDVLARARVDVSVKEDKELWLACQSAGNSTGGRAHGNAVVFFLKKSLVSSLFLSSRHRNLEGT